MNIQYKLVSNCLSTSSVFSILRWFRLVSASVMDGRKLCSVKNMAKNHLILARLFIFRYSCMTTCHACVLVSLKKWKRCLLLWDWAIHPWFGKNSLTWAQTCNYEPPPHKMSVAQVWHLDIKISFRRTITDILAAGIWHLRHVAIPTTCHLLWEEIEET